MYRVKWPDSVTRDLLEAVAKSGPKLANRILAAMSEVESILENDPDIAGESREKGKRFLIQLPLAVTFAIDARKREVRIVHVRVHDKKS
jgi:hypothetical protein